MTSPTPCPICGTTYDRMTWTDRGHIAAHCRDALAATVDALADLVARDRAEMDVQVKRLLAHRGQAVHSEGNTLAGEVSIVMRDHDAAHDRIEALTAEVARLQSTPEWQAPDLRATREELRRADSANTAERAQWSRAAEVLGLAPYGGAYRVEDVLPAVQRLAADLARVTGEREEANRRLAEYVDPADEERAQAIYVARKGDADKLLRAALGDHWNKLWGPELEQLGHVVDGVLEARDAAIRERDAAQLEMAKARGKAQDAQGARDVKAALLSETKQELTAALARAERAEAERREDQQHYLRASLGWTDREMQLLERCGKAETELAALRGGTKEGT